MKAFITVIGRDRTGIIAAVSALLAGHNINIEDISQTVLQGMFTMIMAVDLSQSALPFGELAQKLKAEGEQLGTEITVRNADIYNAMHRI